MSEKCPDCGATESEWLELTASVRRLRDEVQGVLNERSALRAKLSVSEAEVADYQAGAQAEARRCDELLAERNRARNETLAALEKLVASEAEVAKVTAERDRFHDDYWSRVRECERLEAEVARLRQEVEDVRALDEWLKANPDRSLNSTAGWSEALSKEFAHLDQGDARVQIRTSHDVAKSFWSGSLPEARRAAVEYLKAKEGK